MANLGKTQLVDAKGNRYELSLDFDDAALMEDALVTVVSVEKTDASTDEKTKAEAKISLRLKESTITVEMEDLEPIVIKIPESADAFDDDDRDLSDPEEHSTFLTTIFEEGGAAERLEDLLEYVPAGDPSLGCVLKAGVSTTIGQMLQCRSHTKGAETIRRWIWEMLRCLGSNGHVMLGKAKWRTLRCWMTLGAW